MLRSDHRELVNSSEMLGCVVEAKTGLELYMTLSIKTIHISSRIFTVNYEEFTTMLFKKDDSKTPSKICHI